MWDEYPLVIYIQSSIGHCLFGHNAERLLKVISFLAARRFLPIYLTAGRPWTTIFGVFTNLFDSWEAIDNKFWGL